MMCCSSLTFNQHIAQGPGTGAVAESGGAEHAVVGDLVKQLQEKDRRIQIQQLSQVRCGGCLQHTTLALYQSLWIVSFQTQRQLLPNMKTIL